MIDFNMINPLKSSFQWTLSENQIQELFDEAKKVKDQSLATQMRSLAERAKEEPVERSEVLECLNNYRSSHILNLGLSQFKEEEECFSKSEFVTAAATYNPDGKPHIDRIVSNPIYELTENEKVLFYNLLKWGTPNHAWEEYFKENPGTEEKILVNLQFFFPGTGNPLLGFKEYLLNYAPKSVIIQMFPKLLPEKRATLLLRLVLEVTSLEELEPLSDLAKTENEKRIIGERVLDLCPDLSSGSITLKRFANFALSYLAAEFCELRNAQRISHKKNIVFLTFCRNWTYLGLGQSFSLRNYKEWGHERVREEAELYRKRLLEMRKMNKLDLYFTNASYKSFDLFTHLPRELTLLSKIQTIKIMGNGEYLRPQQSFPTWLLDIMKLKKLEITMARPLTPNEEKTKSELERRGCNVTIHT